MSGLKRTLTASDVEESTAADDSGSDTSTCSSSIVSTDNDWEAASISAAGSRHRRYRSGSQPDFFDGPTTDGGWVVAAKRAWGELGFVARLIVMLVTPMAARQFGSMVARRLFGRWFGPIHFQQ